MTNWVYFTQIKLPFDELYRFASRCSKVAKEYRGLGSESREKIENNVNALAILLSPATARGYSASGETNAYAMRRFSWSTLTTFTSTSQSAR